MHTQHEELIVDAAALHDLALEEPTNEVVAAMSAILGRIEENVGLALTAARALGRAPA